MGTSYISADVKCPYYKDDKGQKLICEGIDRGCNTHFQYETTKQKLKRMEKHCTKDYNQCELYQILEKKYKK